LVDWYIGYDGVRLTSQNCGLYRSTIHPGKIAMWFMAWCYRLGLTPYLSTRALWQPPLLTGGLVSSNISLERVEESTKEMRI